MAEEIGKAVARMGQTTGSIAPSTVDWGSIDLSPLRDLPARLDDTRLAAVEAIARLPVPPLAPADEDFFLKSMRTLRLLPTRADDQLSGDLRLALYRRHFGKLSRPQLSYLVEQATLTCRFFPTPAECNAILGKWRRDDTPSRAVLLARRATDRERQARFDELFERFRKGEVSQDEADALPDHWRRIAVERGFLRADTMALRPLDDERHPNDVPGDVAPQGPATTEGDS